MLQFLDNRLKWSETNGEEGVFSPKILKVWHKYRQCKTTDKEAGGILMGRFNSQTKAMLVDELTTPMLRDKRKRIHFYRSNSHDKSLKKYWRKTHSYGGLLGLWHTHPENMPTPSATDIDDLHKQLTRSTYVANRLVYIIVGITHIGVWIGYPNKKREFLGYIEIPN